jgi:hypothetical protein
MRVTTKTRAEFKALHEAISAFVENLECAEEEDVPELAMLPAARALMERCDAVYAALADGKEG